MPRSPSRWALTESEYEAAGWAHLVASVASGASLMGATADPAIDVGRSQITTAANTVYDAIDALVDAGGPDAPADTAKLAGDRSEMPRTGADLTQLYAGIILTPAGRLLLLIKRRRSTV